MDRAGEDARRPRRHGVEDAAPPRAQKRPKPQPHSVPSPSELSQARPNRPSPPRDRGPTLRLEALAALGARAANSFGAKFGAYISPPSMRSFRTSVPSDSPGAAAASPPPRRRRRLTPARLPPSPLPAGSPRQRGSACRGRQRAARTVSSAGRRAAGPSPPRLPPQAPPPCRRCQTASGG